MHVAAPIAWSPRSVAARRGAGPLVGAAIAVELACLLVLVLGADDSHRLLVPAARRAFPGWLAGPLPRIDAGLAAGDIAGLMMVMVLGYGIVLALAPRIQGRWPLAVCIAAILVCGLAPPLLSADVF
ncbi:MAG: hypothetical protein QOE11_469, partial [Solirubrobacteraceae bacterium]|nr:hypothetical protein [Solirubrobacteraceae bacterium]